MKKVLIVGKESYIGESLYAWLKQYPDKYETDMVCPLDGRWKRVDFTKFDTAVDLAGIAHIMKITEDMKDMFYSVNRDLTVEIGKYAKAAGVRHFIYFSSMNVYGDCCGEVTDKNAVNPASFYGDSKLQGDIGLRKLENSDFTVAVVRPPFVYGGGCKGNYNTISKIARKTPIFPTYRNKKSMIYIDNLCEFTRLLIDDGSGGIFTPQNKELVSTSDLVKEIAKCHNHGIWFTSLFNWTIKPMIGLIKKARLAFSNDCYNLELSNDYGFDYCVVNFAESIKRTEL